jgi:hypothetical protein
MARGYSYGVAASNEGYVTGRGPGARGAGGRGAARGGANVRSVDAVEGSESSSASGFGYAMAVAVGGWYDSRGPACEEYSDSDTSPNETSSKSARYFVGVGGAG